MAKLDYASQLDQFNSLRSHCTPSILFRERHGVASGASSRFHSLLRSCKIPLTNTRISAISPPENPENTP